MTFAVVGNDGKVKNEPKSTTSGSVKAVQYDGVGYVFPNGGNVVAELKKQTLYATSQILEFTQERQRLLS